MIGKIKVFEQYVKLGMSPILIKDIDLKEYENKVVLETNCLAQELNGHYEGEDFIPPQWYSKLLEKSKNKYCLLVINEINNISKEEQLKFLELFKYKKISTFELPQNCIIVVTVNNLKEEQISEEIFSLFVHL